MVRKTLEASVFFAGFAISILLWKAGLDWRVVVLWAFGWSIAGHVWIDEYLERRGIQ